MRIACLHTAESNIVIFETAARALGIALDALHHEVRADLLAEAEDAGGLTPEIAASTGLALLSLAQNADVVILTCSTLGACVDIEIVTTSPVPILRADGALASQAVAAADADGKIVVLCTVETTVEPTSRLFLQAAQPLGVTVEVKLIDEAWAMFKSGELNQYLSIIAKAVHRAYAEGASVVALAQASMSGVAALMQTGPLPLSSPRAGLLAALKAAQHERAPNSLL
jgi:hypothetical protein